VEVGSHRGGERGGEEMVWVVAVHGQAQFKVVALAEVESEAEEMAEALKEMGRVVYWKVEEVR